MGIKVNDYPADWYSGDSNSFSSRWITAIRPSVSQHSVRWCHSVVAADIRQELWLDTLSMARPLHNITVGGSLAKLATYYELGKKGDRWWLRWASARLTSPG